jgi:hypothetical protein
MTQACENWCPKTTWLFDQDMEFPEATQKANCGDGCFHEVKTICRGLCLTLRVEKRQVPKSVESSQPKSRDEGLQACRRLEDKTVLALEDPPRFDMDLAIDAQDIQHRVRGDDFASL